jgi:hypothetical protein
MGDPIGDQGTTSARMLGPAEHPGFEEGAVDDQLPATLEQSSRVTLPFGPSIHVIRIPVTGLDPEAAAYLSLPKADARLTWILFNSS